jgi:DNA primase
MIRQPTEADARELLLSSGIRFHDRGDYYSIFCPFHQNNKSASAALYKANWFFKCFGCDTAYFFPKLYEELKGKPWNEQGLFSMAPVPVKDTLPGIYRDAFAIDGGRVTSVYDNEKALAYCRSRGVSDEFMRFFNFQATDLCRFKRLSKDDPVTIWRDRLLIPVNLNGMPYSLEGRDYTRKQTPKCLYPKHCKTDACFNQDSLDKTKTLIVCEGIMDIHKIWSGIDRNVTCTFGVSISASQKQYPESVQKTIK